MPLSRDLTLQISDYQPVGDFLHIKNKMTCKTKACYWKKAITRTVKKLFSTTTAANETGHKKDSSMDSSIDVVTNLSVCEIYLK